MRVEVGSGGGGHHVEVGRVTADAGQVDLGVEGGPAQGLAGRGRAPDHPGGSPDGPVASLGSSNRWPIERPVQKYLGRQVDVRPRRQVARLLEALLGFRVASRRQQHAGLQPDPGHPVAVGQVISAQQVPQSTRGRHRPSR